MDEHEILGHLLASVTAVMADKRLGMVKMRERSLMRRIASELEDHFPDWDIDTDHTRKGDEVKRLQSLGGGMKIINPDILVHKLGEPINLMVIELKLDDNDDIEDDIFKLEGLTDPDRGFNYLLGVHLQLNLQRAEVIRCTVFTGGQQDQGLSLWLRDEFDKALVELVDAV